MRLPNESPKLPGFNVQRFRQECQQYDLTKQQTINPEMNQKQFNEHHINNWYDTQKKDETRNKLMGQVHAKYSNNKLTPSESDAAYETDIDVPK